MILLIDTSERIARVSLVAENHTLVHRQWQSSPELSKQILEAVEAILTEKKLSWIDIDRVAVHRGKPGSSFMALRVGIVTATMLAHGMNRQLVPVSGNSIETITQESCQGEGVEVIEPWYSG